MKSYKKFTIFFGLLILSLFYSSSCFAANLTSVDDVSNFISDYFGSDVDITTWTGYSNFKYSFNNSSSYLIVYPKSDTYLSSGSPTNAPTSQNNLLYVTFSTVYIEGSSLNSSNAYYKLRAAGSVDKNYVFDSSTNNIRQNVWSTNLFSLSNNSQFSVSNFDSDTTRLYFSDLFEYFCPDNYTGTLTYSGTTVISDFNNIPTSTYPWNQNTSGGGSGTGGSGNNYDNYTYYFEENTLPLLNDYTYYEPTFQGNLNPDIDLFNTNYLNTLRS